MQRNQIKLNTPYLWAALLFLQVLYNQHALAQQVNYKPVSGKRIGSPVPLSPDPLVNMYWPAPKAEDELESYQLSPVGYSTKTPKSFDTSKIKSHNEIVVNGNGDLRFDFGQVSAGWLEFDSDDLGDSVSMSISEYNEPAVVNIHTEHHFKTAVATQDGRTYRLQLNKLWYEGVRFGWIHVKAHKKQWHIKNLRLVCQIKPTNYQGSFSSSDPELTKIWYTGAYTVKLNLLKDYFGAILMDRSDRHSWTGDAFPAQAAAMVAFGNFDFVKKNLHNTANLSNDIASYALYWVLSLVDYVNYTGDTQLAATFLENASRKLDLAYAHFGQSPKIAFYGWDERLGAGFENPNDEAQHAYAMLSIRAWTEFSQLMRSMGKVKEADKYAAYAAEKIQSARKESSWLNGYGIHAAADAINTGLTSRAENNSLFIKNFTDRVNRLSYSSFNEWFIISAMAKAEHHDEAIGAIKDNWGGQLRYGGTTFFEVYRPQWNTILNTNDAPPNNQAGYTSFTHPWSSGIVKWLSEEVLGIKPLEPGFKTFAIIPHLGSTSHFVKGSTPTKLGLITASFNSRTGLSTVVIPAGTWARTVALPMGKNIPASLSINGKQSWAAGSSANQSADILNTPGEDFLAISNLGPGTYHFQLKYKKHVAQKPMKELPWIYKVHAITQDSTTGGNWKGSYGKDGFILFNLFKKADNVEKYPDYLSKIRLSRYADINRKINQPEPGLLTEGHETPSFGAVVTKDYNICEQSMTIDLPVNDEKTHRVSLYFLDQDGQDRRSAIEIFDAKTLNLIGPMIYVKNYKQGKYVSFKFKGPIRLRINQVRGINVSLSGLFFDQPDE
jgi:alpha-L-rhamnosidase